MVYVFWLSASLSALSFPDHYDHDIKKAVKLHWADWPFWLDWKAQLYQESRLKPSAVSPVGAAGVAQFMPATWKEMVSKFGYDKTSSPHDAKLAIEAGARYMSIQRRNWSSPRPQQDRQWLAQASYNAGLGNMLKAQKKCEMAVSYPGIVKCLPDITGHHSKETITYVERISRWRYLMHWQGQ